MYFIKIDRYKKPQITNCKDRWMDKQLKTAIKANHIVFKYTENKIIYTPGGEKTQVFRASK